MGERVDKDMRTKRLSTTSEAGTYKGPFSGPTTASSSVMTQLSGTIESLF